MKSHTKFIFLFYLTLIVPLIFTTNAQVKGFVTYDSVKAPIEVYKVDTILVVLPDAFTIKESNAKAIENLSLKKKPFKMTSLPFGGIGLSFANVNGQVALMNGGRGSATFNNRFTFGGGGWGMPKGIELESSEEGIYEFFKMGYGGLEFGYILYPGEKIKFGTNLLVGCGVGFKETVPKSKDGDFKVFPVFEPSIYSQISLSKLLRLDIGLTYRYMVAPNFSYISNKNLNGFTCYIAFLVGSCKCD